MKVILLSDVPKVGKKYAIVDVAPGYARNFLLARSLAEAVTRTNGKRIAELSKKREVEKKKQDDHLDKSLSGLKDVVVSLTRKANEEGHLYAGVTKEELAMELGKIVGVAYSEENIDIEKPIKAVGEFPITVVVGTKKAEFTLKVEAEGAVTDEGK
ncbi:MAG: 50S ribosomal protein L9 [Parcubacteria group bacterium GW2011_GWA2_47_7]|nr:MAG: 50S ribosomal protein L9 [Parcubacteria group bacterium GW2011_GWA2_47_7]